MYKLIDIKGITFYINEIGTSIKVSLNKKEDKYVYACYFYFKGNVVKKHYQNSVDFSHDINLKASKILKVRYFLWNKEKDLRTSQTIDITEQLSLFSMYLYFQDDVSNQYLLNKDVEKYISNIENTKRGRELFENNKFELTSFPAVEWKGWEADPFNNRSWQWALHWFDFNKHLISFHNKTQNDSVLLKLKSLNSSWIETYLYNEGTDFEFVWHDHATALRAEQILLLLFYLKKHTVNWVYSNFDFVLSLFDTLCVLGKKLQRDDFYSKHTNHGLEQVRVLMLLGIFLDNSEWIDISVLRLNDELDFSFTTEGVHKENSPGYHQFVFKIFLSIVEDFPTYVLKDLGPKFENIASKALVYITHILRPDNKLPIIGDTELRPTSDAYANFFAGTIEYENFLYSITQGKRGKAPSKNAIVYPQSGYAIFRDVWGEKKDFTDSIHLIFKAGCLSSYHHQQDENNVTLYAFGEDWLVDSGLYNYINEDPIRHYIRGRQAHNIPVVSNANYNNDFNHRVDNWSIYDYSEDSSNPYVAARNRVLVAVEHDRRISFDVASKKLLMNDKVHSLDERYRDVFFLLHFPNDKKIKVHKNIVSVTSMNSGVSMKIYFSIKPDLITVETGIVEGKIKSITSHISRTYEDSHVLKITYLNRKVTNLETEFIFENQGNK